MSESFPGSQVKPGIFFAAAIITSCTTSCASTSVNPALSALNADGSGDATFNTGAIGGIISIVLQSDGSFNPGTGANGRVSSVALQSDGKVLIGGPLTFINGTNRYASARLNADGSWNTFISDSFNPDLTHLYGASPSYAEIAAVAVQSDGKVLVGGFIALLCSEWEEGCQSRFARFVARLNPNGSRDTSFIPFVGPYELSVVQMPQVKTVAWQPDGKVVVGYVGYGLVRIVRLHANGIRDTNFNTGIRGLGVNSVVPQADGKLLMGGSFNTVNSTNRNGLARLNSDGSLDGSFNSATGRSRCSRMATTPLPWHSLTTAAANSFA